MNAVGLSRLLKAAKTEVATATPNAPPKRWRVLLTPEALPIPARSTALNAAVGGTGNTMATPIPVNAIGIASRQYSMLALASDANHTKLAACPSIPLTSSAPNAVGQRTRQSRKEQRPRGPPQEPQTGIEWRVSDRQLEVLRYQEDAAEHRARLEEPS
jgi:hypothetical protein